ncbi:hypothetical protein V2J09_004825, partial [Rumex salicifolius]
NKLLKKSNAFASSEQCFNLIILSSTTPILSSPAMKRMVDWGTLNWIYTLICLLSIVKIDSLYVQITYLTSAVASGAVCLDGSPAAYHLHRGSGTGINSWLVHMEGGGWCNNVTTCLSRKTTSLGSSRKMVTPLAFSGILGNNPMYNPDFYNWNRVKIRYCDGSSFTGDVEAVNPVTKLHFRGSRIWLAVMEELLAKGMKSAENAILSGCSAGGLTSILHCDSFRALLPIGTKVKCLSDAGFFVNVPDVSRARYIESYFKQIVDLHGSVRNLPSYCTTKSPRPYLCFFPQYMVRQIRTPLFILNAAYDSWQIKNVLAPVVADPRGDWSDCKLDIKNCSPSQLKMLQKHVRFPIGVLVSSDQARQVSVQRLVRKLVLCPLSNRITGDLVQIRLSKTDQYGIPYSDTIAKAVGDWFYDRIPFQHIDCPYPCDRTCHNRVFSPEEHPGI